jgi:hypothetical protein
MNRIAHEIADYTVLSPGYVKIIAQYYLMRKFNPLRALYARLRQKQNKQDVLRQFVQMFNEPFARECITVCENLMQEGPRIGIPPVVCPPQTDIKQPYEEIDARGRIFPWER